MNKQAFSLACFKVTQELARTGKIPENQSCQHALDRGAALADVARAVSSVNRARFSCVCWWGSPQWKSANTRLENKMSALGAALGEPVRLSFPNMSNWPDVVLRDTLNDVMYFKLPNPESF
jgi:hypothetical protein